MATGHVMPNPVFTGFDNNGVIVPGGLLWTYAAGTTTPLATYTDVGLTTPNTNPVVLSSAGRAVVFMSAASYKFELQTAAAVVLWTQDNIFSPGVSAGTVSDLVITGGLVVGFNTTPLADVILLGDASCGFNFNSGNPLLVFDSGDYFGYGRAANVFAWVIGSSTQANLDSSGLALAAGLIVGFLGTPSADAVKVGDANFGLNFNAGNPVVGFDVADFIGYTRATNNLTFNIANTLEATITADGLAIANGLSVGVSGGATPVDDKIILGDSDLALEYISNTSVRLKFDTTTSIAYDRTTKIRTDTINSATSTIDGSAVPVMYRLGTFGTEWDLVLRNSGAGVFGNIRWRNNANTQDLPALQLNASDQLVLGVSATDIKWGKALVALGGGAAPTLGTIGGSGPAAAGQNTWMRVIDSTGAAFFVPAWK